MTEEQQQKPYIPSTVTEFAQMAKNYISKSKESGVSNTAIANTIELLSGLFQLQQKENLKDSSWQDTDGDGIVDSLMDNQTGKVISSFSSNTNSDDAIWDIINEGESAYDDLYKSQTSDFTQEGDLDLDAFYENYGISEQPGSDIFSSTVKNLENLGQKKDPVSGTMGVNLSGLNLNFNQPTPEDQLSISKPKTQGVNWQNMGF